MGIDLDEMETDDNDYVGTYAKNDEIDLFAAKTVASLAAAIKKATGEECAFPCIASTFTGKQSNQPTKKTKTMCSDY